MMSGQELSKYLFDLEDYLMVKHALTTGEVSQLNELIAQ